LLPTHTHAEIDSNQFVTETKTLIGSGSFARVYRANYRGIDVAVKVFKPSELPTRIDNEVRILGYAAHTSRHSLWREIRRLTSRARSLNDVHRKLRGHPNVVRVVGYCVVNEQKQIAMEYCAYGNLHECIQNITRGLGRHGRRKTEKGQAFEATRRSTRRSRGTRAM
jgi:serine/threonine protein kinase